MEQYDLKERDLEGVISDLESGMEKGGRDVQPLVKWVWGEIEFKGATSGKFLLTTSLPLALTLATNTIGAEEKENSEGELLDAVSELNNMISGNLFSLLNQKGRYSLNKAKTELILEEEKKKRSPESGLKIYFNAEQRRWS